MEATTIQRNDSAISATNAASTARLRLPRGMCAIALPTSKGCLVNKRVASPLVTGSVPRYSTNQKPINAQATAPMVQRQAISAKIADGLRNVARKPSRVGDGGDIHNCS